MPKIYKVRELKKRLRKHDPAFEFWYSGKGHLMIYHPRIGGQERSYPIKCHGDNDEVGKYVLADIEKIFRLPKTLL
ncbi:hypothetical protein K8I61_13460 [bacterium]|nr:hypothetical protein [bacterium]